MFSMLAEVSCFNEYRSYLALRDTLVGLWTGNGEPVMVLPPFMSDDASTRPLRDFLSRSGYHVEGWGLGVNEGHTAKAVMELPERVLGMRDRTGAPVSLVGWSAGGILAREVARQIPSAVRRVVSLGSPFRFRPGDGSHLDVLYEKVEHLQVPMVAERLKPEHERPRLPVPSTAVYSRGDGIAGWEACMEFDGVNSESVEIRGSHVGMGFNPAALIVVGERLAQKSGSWSRFTPPSRFAYLFP
jgi:pimeloyl-ACP methyl ester carboxylesterase